MKLHVYGVAKIVITVSLAILNYGNVSAHVSDMCLKQSDPPPGSEAPASAGESSVAYQQFPASGELETAWYVTFDHGTSKALYLTGAYFKPGQNRDWVQVLGWAGLSDLFVPYQSGYLRLFDLSGFEFDLVDANLNDAGPMRSNCRTR